MSVDQKTQLERIAIQVEMLKIAKPIKSLTDEEFKVVTLRAEDLIKTLGLSEEMPDEWVKR